MEAGYYWYKSAGAAFNVPHDIGDEWVVARVYKSCGGLRMVGSADNPLVSNVIKAGGKFRGPIDPSDAAEVPSEPECLHPATLSQLAVVASDINDLRRTMGGLSEVVEALRVGIEEVKAGTQ